MKGRAEKARARRRMRLKGIALLIGLAVVLLVAYQGGRWLENRMDGSDNYDLATTDTLVHTSGMYRYQEKKGDEG